MSWLGFSCNTGKQLLDFADGFGWIQMLWASLGAVQDGVAFECRESISHAAETVNMLVITGINDPSKF